MSAITATTDTVSARRDTLRALDRMVRDEIALAACRWAMDAGHAVELTAYDRVYRRTPALGGHWTLFSARLTDAGHEVDALQVSVEFEDEQPVDLRVSGVHEVLAGACSAVALREALFECEGPLRQVTPLGRSATPHLVGAALDLMLAAAR